MVPLRSAISRPPSSVRRVGRSPRLPVRGYRAPHIPNLWVLPGEGSKSIHQITADARRPIAEVLLLYNLEHGEPDGHGYGIATERTEELHSIGE